MISFQRNKRLTFRSSSSRYFRYCIIVTFLVIIVALYFRFGHRNLSDFLQREYDTAKTKISLRKNTLKQLKTSQNTMNLLRQSNAALQFELLRYKNLSDENSSLRGLLSLQSRHENSFVLTEFIAHHTFLGRDEFTVKTNRDVAVQKFSPVFDNDILIGMVFNVHGHYLTIIPLTDRRVQIPVTIARLGKRFIMKGSGHMDMNLRFVSDSEDLVVGDEVTVNLDEGRFKVGYISDIEHVSGELFSLVSIKPARGHYDQKYFGILNVPFGTF